MLKFTRNQLSQKGPSKMFIGRSEEISKINRMLLRQEQSVCLIFGRRRIGKTELIKHVLEESAIPGLYYECKETSEANNAASINDLIAEHFGIPVPAFSSVEETLTFLFQQAEKAPLIFVLDEYPYLQKTGTGMDSILQSLIDKYKSSSKMKLILCGSFVDTMKSLLEKQNPLYGRVDLTLELLAMDYYDSAEFYPDFSDEDKVRLYSVFGGIPYYNRLIENDKSVRENIIDLIASPGARLENEVSMNLKSELAKVTNANEVFDALARGFSKYNDILSQSHVSSSPALADVLDKLCRMQVVEKTAPINDANNRKKASYRICDNLSLFYYKYIFRYSSQMRIMNTDIFYDRYIADDFETQYVPKAFEEICKQFLIRMNRNGLMEEPFDQIGRYYYDDPETKTNGEFDIVTHDDKGYIFYEVKFRTKPLDKTTIETEIDQVKRTILDCYKYGFISRSGFEKDINLNDLVLINIRDLYVVHRSSH